MALFINECIKHANPNAIHVGLHWLSLNVIYYPIDQKRGEGDEGVSKLVVLWCVLLEAGLYCDGKLTRVT